MDVRFEHGIAAGWVFDMPEASKSSLDILYSKLIDKTANEEKKKRLRKNSLDEDEKIYRYAWTRGVPPAVSFAVGDIFYEPSGTRSMKWGDALTILRRVVQIIHATPDPGALPASEHAEHAASPVPDATSARSHAPGKVLFEITHYESAKELRSEVKELSQKTFAEFLRTGA